jgi:hypothetical protein
MCTVATVQTLQPPLDGRGGGLPVAAATSNSVSGGYGGHQQQQQPGYAPNYSQPPAQVSFTLLYLHLILLVQTDVLRLQRHHAQACANNASVSHVVVSYCAVSNGTCSTTHCNSCVSQK